MYDGHTHFVSAANAKFGIKSKGFDKQKVPKLFFSAFDLISHQNKTPQKVLSHVKFTGQDSIEKDGA